MKKLMILSLTLILGLSTVAAADFTNLQIVEDPEMTAGETGEALIEFTYEGNQFDGNRDPFVLNVSFEGEETRADHFDVDGELRFEEGGNQQVYDLECSSGGDVDSRQTVGDFYQGKVDQINDQSQLCFTEDAITVLPSYSVVDGEVDLNVTPDVRMAPGSYDIQYEFAGWTGLPEFDPVVSTGENGVINGSSDELLEDRGIRLEADPNINFTVVSYSYINAETDRPETEEFVRNYYELRPHQDTSGSIELEYNQEQVNSREREDPRLYGCEFEDQDCSWDLIAQGEDGVIETESQFNYSLYGVFTSNIIEEEVVVDDGSDGSDDSGGGSSFSVGGDDDSDEQDQEDENDSEASEVEEVQIPTAFFEVDYTEPELSENVQFDASNSYSPNSQIESYDWSFGDRGPQAVHSFEQDEVNVTLTVTDEEGGEDRYSQVINFEQAESEEETDGQDQAEGLTGGFAQSPFNPMNLFDEIAGFISNIF